MLLDLYEKYLPNIGPMKTFKTKKHMWNKIVELINQRFHTNKTGVQAENRYKTLLKRKKNAIDNNQRSGAGRQEIPYEDELKKIASMDDSIMPEVIGTASSIKILKRPGSVDIKSPAVNSLPSTSSSTEAALPQNNTEPIRKRIKTIQETLKEIHEKREEGKERRHQEKLQLIERLFGNKQN